jgi:hypothetical protein
MGRKILLGFAGPGEVSPNNVKDLLRDKLGLGPEDSKGLPAFPGDVEEIRVVFPAAEAYWNPTLELLLEWTVAYADLPYEVVFDHETRENRQIIDEAEEAIPARNVSAAMIERLVEGQKDGDDVKLIVAYGEDGDDRTELLIDHALVKDIKVLDLTAGLDDVRIAGSGVPEPEPEPEEKPTRRSRRTAKTAEATEEPVEESAEEPVKPTRRGKPRKAAEASPAPAVAATDGSVEQDVSRARQAAQKATEVTEDDLVSRALLAASHYIAAQDAMNAAKNLSDTVEPSPLSLLLAEAVEAYQPPKRGPGRPRKDGSPAKARGPEDRATKEWLTEDGEWVKAGRGRIPKGVHTRTVDPQTGEVLSQD